MSLTYLCKLTSEDTILFKSKHRCLVCHRKKCYEHSKKYKAKNIEKINAYQKEYRRAYFKSDDIYKNEEFTEEIVLYNERMT